MQSIAKMFGLGLEFAIHCKNIELRIEPKNQKYCLKYLVIIADRCICMKRKVHGSHST